MSANPQDFVNADWARLLEHPDGIELTLAPLPNSGAVVKSLDRGVQISDIMA